MLFRKWFSVPSTPPRRRFESFFIDKDFQLKYTFMGVTGAATGMLLAGVPILYLVNENYQIFFKLAMDSAPSLLSALEREQVLMNQFFVFVFLGLLIFFFLIGLKISARLVAPIKILQKHIRALSRGQFNVSSITIRESDEFHDLIENYNYLYRSLQLNLKLEVEKLHTVSKSVKDKYTHQILMDLIDEKSSQLNLDSNLPKLSPLREDSATRAS